jgi:hypothetical protein
MSDYSGMRRESQRQVAVAVPEVGGALGSQVEEKAVTYIFVET